MNTITIRHAADTDAPAIATMLQRLADDIGDADVFLSDEGTVRRDGFGATPFFHCMIAENGRKADGLVVFFPHYSTTRAQPGAFVLDLWVDPSLRGTGTGRRLLAAAVRHARKSWRARYLALTVYRANGKALRFYRQLGFSVRADDIAVALDGPAFGKLIDLADEQR